MKKRSKKFLSLTLSLSLALTLVLPTARAAEITVTEVLEPKYDDMQAFSEGLAPVCLNIGGTKRWGYIDATGREVIACKYDGVGEFTDGMASVMTGSIRESTAKYGYIDKTGREVIPVRYRMLFPFSDGLALSQEGTTGDTWRRKFLDRNGNVVIDGDYLNVDSFFITTWTALSTKPAKWSFLLSTDPRAAFPMALRRCGNQRKACRGNGALLTRPVSWLYPTNIWSIPASPRGLWRCRMKAKSGV